MSNRRGFCTAAKDDVDDERVYVRNSLRCAKLQSKQHQRENNNSQFFTGYGHPSRLSIESFKALKTCCVEIMKRKI